MQHISFKRFTSCIVLQLSSTTIIQLVLLKQIEIWKEFFIFFKKNIFNIQKNYSIDLNCNSFE
jgi:hypothetical protein